MSTKSSNNMSNPWNFGILATSANLKNTYHIDLQTSGLWLLERDDDGRVFRRKEERVFEFIRVDYEYFRVKKNMTTCKVH